MIKDTVNAYCKYKSRLLYGKKILKECLSSQDVVEVEEGTEVIAPSAFWNCSLKEVRLPDSLEEIQSHAFMDCMNLQKIVFGKNIKIIEQASFANCHSISEIVFPEKSKIIDAVFRSNVWNNVSNEYKDAQPSIESLFRSVANIENRFEPIGETEMLKKLQEFFDSGKPKLSVKLTYGKRSIWLPKYISPYDIMLIKNVTKAWIMLGLNGEMTLDLASNIASRIGMAVEMYALGKDHIAEKYLKNNIIDIVKYLLKIGDNRVLVGIIQLGLIGDSDFYKVLSLLIDAGKTEIAAYILTKNGKFPADKSSSAGQMLRF